VPTRIEQSSLQTELGAGNASPATLISGLALGPGMGFALVAVDAFLQRSTTRRLQMFAETTCSTRVDRVYLFGCGV